MGLNTFTFTFLPPFISCARINNKKVLTLGGRSPSVLLPKCIYLFNSQMNKAKSTAIVGFILHINFWKPLKEKEAKANDLM